MYSFLSLIGAVALTATTAFAQSAGCGSGEPLTSGVYTTTISGIQRSYTLAVPENYDSNNPYRLIFGLHWLSGTMEDVATGQTVEAGTWAYYGLQQLADNSAIFVAPQGIDNGWANTNGDDLAFIDDIISTVEGSLCVNQDLRFATGFSYGGAMSYALACDRPDVFRAVAVLSGGLLSGCGGGNTPVAYLGIHGISDSVLPINLGHQLRDTFVNANGCDAAQPAEPQPGSLSHIKTEYTGCSEPVVWIAFDGDHTPAPWDGGPGDNGSQAYSPGETWEFFSQFT